VTPESRQERHRRNQPATCASTSDPAHDGPHDSAARCTGAITLPIQFYEIEKSPFRLCARLSLHRRVERGGAVPRFCAQTYWPVRTRQMATIARGLVNRVLGWILIDRFLHSLFSFSRRNENRSVER